MLRESSKVWRIERGRIGKLPLEVVLMEDVQEFFLSRIELLRHQTSHDRKDKDYDNWKLLIAS